jgi:hypothetical protein
MIRYVNTLSKAAHTAPDSFLCACNDLFLRFGQNSQIGTRWVVWEANIDPIIQHRGPANPTGLRAYINHEHRADARFRHLHLPR